MTKLSAISLSLICRKAKTDETDFSKGLRITGVALGALAVLLGILILAGIPGLSQLGTTAGWVNLSCGLLVVLMALSLRCEKKGKTVPTPSSKPIESKPKASQPSPQALLRKSIESALKAFYDWFSVKGNLLGKGDSPKLIKAVTDLSKTLPTEEISLYHYQGRFGWQFYYGERTSDKKLIPISFREGRILKWQFNGNGKSWPILDGENNYRLAKVTDVVMEFPPSGSTPTSSYIASCLNAARLDRRSNEFKLLEVLIPYANLIKDGLKDESYQDLRCMIPAYPENP